MPEITYTAAGGPDLDAIAPLWARLKSHHRAMAEHFQTQFDAVDWPARKAGLLRRAAGGGLHLDLARDGDTLVGYCVTTVDARKRAELESVFIEEGYRRRGIRAALVEKALAWMDAVGADRREVAIAAGNEEVLPFYRRFGFEVRAVVMQQTDRQ